MNDAQPDTQRGRQPLRTFASYSTGWTTDAASRSSSVASFANSDYSSFSNTSSQTSYSEHSLGPLDHDVSTYFSDEGSFNFGQSKAWSDPRTKEALAADEGIDFDIEITDSFGFRAFENWTDPAQLPQPEPQVLSRPAGDVVPTSESRNTTSTEAQLCSQLCDATAPEGERERKSAVLSLRALREARAWLEEEGWPKHETRFAVCQGSASENTTPRVPRLLFRDLHAPQTKLSSRGRQGTLNALSLPKSSPLRNDSASRQALLKEGQQRQPPHPRRTKTDPTWCKPSLVREENRKMAYVNKVVDVAVSLIAHIWPAAERPLKVHNPATGTSVIGLHYFVEQILRRSHASNSTLQIALYYCYKLKQSDALYKRPATKPTQSGDGALWCGRRMFLASLMLAFKFLQDRGYSSKAWAGISGLSVKDINHNEAVLLKALKYETFVRNTTFFRWQETINRAADDGKKGQDLWSVAHLAMLGGGLSKHCGKSCEAVGCTKWGCAHRIKGSNGAFGFASWQDFTPHIQRIGHFAEGLAGSPQSQPLAHPTDADATLPCTMTIDDIAACTPIPESPGYTGPVAPAAPTLGTITPPKPSPDEAVTALCLLRPNGATNDNDSGYDSASPKSVVTDNMTNDNTARHSQCPCSNPDDHRPLCCSWNPTSLTHRKTGSTTTLPLRPMPALPERGEERDVSHRHVECAQVVKEPQQQVEHLPEQDENELASSDIDDLTFYEMNFELVEGLEEDANQHLAGRQHKREKHFPSTRCKKRTHRTYSTGCGDEVQHGRWPKNAQKSVKLSKARATRA